MQNCQHADQCCSRTFASCNSIRPAESSPQIPLKFFKTFLKGTEFEKVIKELHQTESTYILNVLRIIVEEFCVPLKQSAINLPLPERMFINKIFGNVEDIYSFHLSFYKELSDIVHCKKTAIFEISEIEGVPQSESQDTVEHAEEMKKAIEIAKHFVLNKKSFLLYEKFCLNLCDIKEEGAAFASEKKGDALRLIHNMETNSSSLGLFTLLELIFQRIFKYPQLLKRAEVCAANISLENEQKHAGKISEIRRYFQTAEGHFSDLVEHLNESTRDFENTRAVLELANSISGSIHYCDNFSFMGRLKVQVDLDMLTLNLPSSSVKDRTVTAFFFEQSILLCKAVSKSTSTKSKRYEFLASYNFCDYDIFLIISENSTSESPKHLQRGNSHLILMLKKRQRFLSKIQKTVYTTKEDATWLKGALGKLEIFASPSQKTAIFDFVQGLRNRLSFETLYCQMNLHSFSYTSLYDHAECFACGRLLKGLTFQGYRCTKCSKSLHFECLTKAHTFQCQKIFHNKAAHQTFLFDSEAYLALRDVSDLKQPALLKCSKFDIIHVFGFEENGIPIASVKSEIGYICADDIRKLAFSKSFSCISKCPGVLKILRTCVSDNLCTLNSSTTSPHNISRSAISLNHTAHSIEENVWYHGEIDRKEACRLLSHYLQRNGVFLVRYSVKQSSHIISFVADGNVRHRIIVNNSQKTVCENVPPKFSLEPDTLFPNIPSLILHYHNHMLKHLFCGTALEFALLNKQTFVVISSIPRESQELPDEIWLQHLRFRDTVTILDSEAFDECGAWIVRDSAQRTGLFPLTFLVPDCN